MEAIWDLIKGLGSLVGLATGTFIVWDRFFRMTPVAVVAARPLSPGGFATGAFLQVRNRSDRPILVSWENGNRCGRFGIAQDNSTRGIVASLIPGRTTIVIDTGEAKELLLLKPSDADEMDPDNRIEAELFWRYAQPKIWQRDRKIRISIPKRSMIALDPGEYANQEAE